MQKNRSRAKFLKSDRAREWVTDFMIGIGMFVLVALFASTHTSSALPAPLAKTQAAQERSASGPAIDKNRIVGVPREALLQVSSSREALMQNTAQNNTLMIFMALMFSALMTLTIHFWRNLRRAYATPHRQRQRQRRA